MIAILLICVVLCLPILYFYFRRNYGYWKERGIPYEEPTVLVGNLKHLFRSSMSDFMYDIGKKYINTDYTGIFLGQQQALVINSKELAKRIFVKDFDCFQNRYSYAGDKEDPLGALNLFTVKNPTWSAMKHEMAPLFTSLRLKGITELMNINSAELVRRIETDCLDNKKSVNIKELSLMYTSDTVGYTVFGLRVSALKNLTSPLWYLIRPMVQWTFWRGFEFTMVLCVPAVAKFLRLKFFSATSTEYIKKLFWNVVEERKNQIQTNDKDLVNHLTKLKDKIKVIADGDTKLVDDLIIAQVAVFILGAVETSATTLTLCLHELAYHPEKQENLYKEIRGALDTKEKSVLEYNDYMELKYLTGCIKETLRKYPALGFLDRMCNKTYKLNDEVTIEKGTPVYINVSAIHFNEEYYPESKEWRPERFVGSSDNDNHNFTFLTFGEGPRACIGKRYGYMQLRTALAHILTKFRVEPGEPYEIKNDPYSVILTPLGAVRVKFVPR